MDDQGSPQQDRRKLKRMDEDITREITRKAMAFDLFNIIDSDAAQETHIKDEIKALIRQYIDASN